MKRALFLSALLIAVGMTAALWGQHEWAEAKRLAGQASIRLDTLRQQKENGNPQENTRLRERLTLLLAQGFFQKPTEANFQIFAGLDMQSERAQDEEADGITTGFVTLTWQARHMEDFITRWHTLQARWRASSSLPPAPLIIQNCQFVRAQNLAVSCRVRWQAASWPGEAMPKTLPESAPYHSPDSDLPVLGRLFYTSHERAELDRQAREALSAATVWQGMVRLERAGKSRVWKDGLFVDTDHSAPEAIGGATQDLLRGGTVYKEGEKE
ncbi:MAG: hypothetical protein LBQ75_07890 [Zoogloeaceae bacterium]|jgi:hypothetical protein|nr:hypothetical protein [Zoogloeaceae bacterium]